MQKAVTLYLILITSVLSLTASVAHAESISSPLQQERDGVPLNEITCSVGRALMQSPFGSPACIFAESIGTLTDRGFVQIGSVVDVTISLETEPATIPAEIASASNSFAIDFYKQIADDDNSANHFFSPSSMHAVFSVLYEGARGETAKELRDAFGIIEDDVARYQDVSDTMSSLNRDDPHAVLETANSMWLADRLVPHEQYVDIVRSTYRADVETVDFTDASKDGAVALINGWADEKTRGKISKVLGPGDVGANTVVAILNAIYFKGTWVSQFDEEDTHEQDFVTGNGTIKADFMSIEETLGYTYFDGTEILRMPYVGDRLSMLVVLPSQRAGIDALEESLSVEMLEEWQRDIYDTEIIVSIPKFEIKTHYDLIPKLKDLGVTLIFDSTGDLSGISDTNLFVGKAIQDAYVQVNEEGTEAAAVTVITGDESGPRYFTANHPFLFFIQDDESGMILFMGKIVNPTL